MKGMGLFLCLAVLTVSAAGCSGIKEEMEDFAENGVIATPDLSGIDDGSYEGKYRSGVVNVKVLVTVSEHAITGIEILKHFNGQGGPAEAIVDDIIEKQSLDVDAVTGATYSSKVIRKAVEVALTQDI